MRKMQSKNFIWGFVLVLQLASEALSFLPAKSYMRQFSRGITERYWEKYEHNSFKFGRKYRFWHRIVTE